MKRLILLLGTAGITATSSITAYAQPQGVSLNGVICARSEQGQRLCTKDEMRALIRALKAAKTEALNTDEGSLRKAGKGMVVVGGTWFASSMGMFLVEEYLGLSIIDLLAKVVGKEAIGSFVVGGLKYGLASTVLGGLILAVTPSKTADGTVTGFFMKDENFGKLLDLNEEQILALIQQDPALGNKIVGVSAVLLAQAK